MFVWRLLRLPVTPLLLRRQDRACYYCYSGAHQVTRGAFSIFALNFRFTGVLRPNFQNDSLLDVGSPVVDSNTRLPLLCAVEEIFRAPAQEAYHGFPTEIYRGRQQSKILKKNVMKRK